MTKNVLVTSLFGQINIWLAFLAQSSILRILWKLIKIDFAKILTSKSYLSFLLVNEFLCK